MAFLVCAPNEPPESGYSPVGDSVASLDAALDTARDVARSGGPRTTVYVEEHGTTNVWSVSFHPDAPQFLGVDADGAAIVEWGVEFREVHDPTYRDEDGVVVGEITVSEA